jgi:hypothetical protein
MLTAFTSIGSTAEIMPGVPDIISAVSLSLRSLRSEEKPITRL